ncbi:hypothetical protein D8T51_23435 [Vibrio vulnificus]|uniref:hypothetical protein n=1 Tax=Vibrio TaxID=662 RepID=UPI001023E9CB|nr:hypothetical protein [Vibrio vulnificus]EGQ7997948.1 hypothetical protein [Vibrio vulnificus]EGR0130406.1 hypothetical protein [Vibrio vulnificus]EGR0753586.1 hypothetical protein [Vibrio vulnificus]EHH1182838.1 hypothetical protein [Vibrio vulnificus]EHH1191762.1 hypothetical protein [Vibrio vulnificus]
MLSAIRDLFVPHKDYAGRNIDAVISRLAAQTGTDAYVWSYIRELSVYENTLNGMRVYPHELRNHAS